MLRKVLKAVKNYNMFTSGDNVIIGISGGADSVFLIHALFEIKEIYSLNLYAVHINHGIRGGEALRDESFVIDLCRGMGIPLTVRSFDARAYASEMGMSTEEAGRSFRYLVFSEEAEKLSGAKIAVAHNKNDCAETVILNLCRGSGLSGLCGIPAVNGGVIRPVIDITRGEIENYLNFNKIPFVTDSSNQSPLYSRNVIRHMVIPELTERINSNAVRNINNFASLAREEDSYLNSLALDALAECKSGDGLSVTKLNVFPEVLQKRIIRLVIRGMTSLRDIGSANIEEVLKLKQGISGKMVRLPHGFTVMRVFDELRFEPDSLKPESKGFCYNLGYTLSGAGCSMRVEGEGFYVQASRSFIPGGRVFYAVKAPDNLEVRSRRAGDAIYFSEIGGHKRIKDFFTEQKIPENERDNIPLVVSGSEVFWIAGKNRDVFSSPPRDQDSGKYEEFYIKVWH